MTTTTTTDVSAGVRTTLARLLEWLTSHPDLPLCTVDFADGDGVDLSLADLGGLGVLTAAADVAGALDHSWITVSDPEGRTVTELTVDGWLADNPVAVQVEATVEGEARTRLLASLGAPADPESRRWLVTAEHLRGLAGTAGTAASA